MKSRQRGRMKIKKCPCGKTPTKIIIQEDRIAKWSMAFGDCCSDWIIEFRTHYKKPGSPELYKLAVDAWNEMPRGER